MDYNKNVLRRVRYVEAKNGIVYAKKNGQLYKTLKLLYAISGLYTLVINLIYIAGMLFVNSTSENVKINMNSILTVIFCTVLLIAGYVMTYTKLDLAAGIISGLSEIFLILTFAVSLKDNFGFMGFKSSFYLRHFVPLLILLILITWLTVIAVRAENKTKLQYRRVLSNLYSLYNIGEGRKTLADITEEQWQEFLRNYDPSDYKSLFKIQDTWDDNSGNT